MCNILILFSQALLLSVFLFAAESWAATRGMDCLTPVLLSFRYKATFSPQRLLVWRVIQLLFYDRYLCFLNWYFASGYCVSCCTYTMADPLPVITFYLLLFLCFYFVSCLKQVLGEEVWKNIWINNWNFLVIPLYPVLTSCIPWPSTFFLVSCWLTSV